MTVSLGVLFIFQFPAIIFLLDYFAETDDTVNKKVLKAFEHKITPIICCGESLVQREQGITIALAAETLPPYWMRIASAVAAS